MWEPMHLNMLDYSNIEYRVEQLMLGHMFNIINGNAPTYLISGINMNQRKFNLETKKLLISALSQCQFDYTCSAWYTTDCRRN